MQPKEITFTRETVLNSPSMKEPTFEQAVDKVANYIREVPDAEYEIAIGTDSMTYDKTKFVMAITVHRIGKGGIFFWKNFYEEKFKKYQLFDKIYTETDISLNASKTFLELLKEKGIDIDETEIKIRFTVHVDVGNYGKTRDYIQTLVGMVHSYGYDCEIKPSSYAASSIANKLSK